MRTERGRRLDLALAPADQLPRNPSGNEPVPLKLILANKAYSSWSLRPWILLAQLKIPFEEVIIPMDQPATRAKMLKYAPTGKCPSLQDGKIVIWESLAIIEYLAEAYPEKTVWPKGKAARAHARALASEMHAGFVALRQTCPTNFRRPVKAIPLNDEVKADAARIEAYLNSVKSLKARFSQVAGDGGVSQGTAWLERPGNGRPGNDSAIARYCRRRSGSVNYRGGPFQ